MKPIDYPPTPELDKLKAVAPFSQKIGEFLDIFLAEKGIQLGKPHVHDERCNGWDAERKCYNPGSGLGGCSFCTGEFESCYQPVEKLLAEFFEIDLDKVESERRAILEIYADSQENTIT